MTEQDDRYTYEIGTLLPGTPYLIEKKLGAGGMGVVYGVRHTFLNRREALKTIHPELVDRADIAQRMKHEAEVQSSLRHPNIVQVTGGGVIEDAWRLPYFAMEMLNGRTVRDMIRRRALTDIETIHTIAYEMLDALAEAHAAGVVHRDVKPENLFLHNDASRVSGPRVSTKLLDFGIMAVLGGRQSRQFRGTFRYASPEQLRGDPVSPQTDLYGAGLVIYEMIAGRGPFDDIEQWRDIAKAHLEKEAPPLSYFAEVPASLDRLLASALSKNPSKRPESALAFVQQLYLLKQIAENRPLAPLTARTEETLLTAIEPTDEGPAFDGAMALAPTKPSRRTNQDAPRNGRTVEGAEPPERTTTDRMPVESMVFLEKTDVDRKAVTRTLEPWPKPAPRNGTEPFGDSLDLAPPKEQRRQRVTESNVTPPPVSSSRARERPHLEADTVVEPPPASSVTKTRRKRPYLALGAIISLCVGILAWAAVRRPGPSTASPSTTDTAVSSTSTPTPPPLPRASTTSDPAPALSDPPAASATPALAATDRAATQALPPGARRKPARSPAGQAVPTVPAPLAIAPSPAPSATVVDVPPAPAPVSTPAPAPAPTAPSELNSTLRK